MALFWLDESLRFPSVDLAEDDGLLAVGGDLSVERLYAAYRSGVFPWYSEGQPILWWSPNPRFILLPDEFKIAASLRRIARSSKFDVTFDQAFEEVIDRCGTVPRRDGEGTWITPEMREAYVRFYRAGYAHSVEAWRGDKLVGGLYGVALGQVFFGESMFTEVSNAGKVALVHLVKRFGDAEGAMIDCQVFTAHLEAMGARAVPRTEFMERLKRFAVESAHDSWSCMTTDAPLFHATTASKEMP